MTTTDTTQGLGERDGIRWWPTALGLLIGIGAGLGSNGVDVAWVVAISAFVYVGAAATGSGRSAWWWFLGSGPLITLGQIFDAPAGLTWAVVVIAALVAVWGIARGHWSDPGGLSLQSLAMVAFGAVSLLAFVVDTTAVACSSRQASSATRPGTCTTTGRTAWSCAPTPRPASCSTSRSPS